MLQGTNKTLYSQRPDFTDPEKYLWVSTNPHHNKNIYAGCLDVFKDRLCSGEDFDSPHFHPVPQFSIYPNAKNTWSHTVVNIFQVIRLMQSEKLKGISEQIAAARKTGNEELRKRLKNSLPYITHSGIFEPRNNESLKQPGFTYQLDIDGISNPEEILKKLIKDKQLHVLFASVSVSGNGVKAMLFFKDLIFLSDTWPWPKYREAYHQLTPFLNEYFKENYSVPGIDRQMKAISQPFFLYYAADLFINKTFRRWV
jgi:hypothetical protein